MRAPQLMRIAGLALTGLLAISPRTLSSQDSGAGAKPPAESHPPTIAPDEPSGERAWRAHGFTAEQRTRLREAFTWGIEKRFIRIGLDTPKLASALFGFVKSYF